MVYSFYRALTGEGGGGLEDFVVALSYTSVLLFIASVTIIIINFRHLKQHIDTIFFILIGLPLTFASARAELKYHHYNREPDLTVKYPRPVSDQQFKRDSVNIKMAIDSLAVLKNKTYGGRDIVLTIIDTIIYSPKGDKVFVSFINRYESDNINQDFQTDFLYADKRDSISWQWQKVSYGLGGAYPDQIILKKEVRKFYFNQFSFLDQDSATEKYFWRRITYSKK
jgi:hypothetical protein